LAVLVGCGILIGGLVPLPRLLGYVRIEFCGRFVSVLLFLGSFCGCIELLFLLAPGGCGRSEVTRFPEGIECGLDRLPVVMDPLTKRHQRSGYRRDPGDYGQGRCADQSEARGNRSHRRDHNGADGGYRAKRDRGILDGFRQALEPVDHGAYCLVELLEVRSQLVQRVNDGIAQRFERLLLQDIEHMRLAAPCFLNLGRSSRVAPLQLIHNRIVDLLRGDESLLHLLHGGRNVGTDRVGQGFPRRYLFGGERTHTAFVGE